ncbi:MAG: ATP-binding protein, partial [Spirochaetota bacterium]
NPEIVDRIHASEPYGYVLKPFREEDIFTAVSVALTIRRMEMRLKEKDERLSAALSAARVGTWRTDSGLSEISLDGRMCAILGMPGVDTVLPIDEFLSYVHPEYKETVVNESIRSYNEGAEFEIYIQTIRSDGTGRWLKDRGICCTSSDGRSRYLTGAVVDITERKKLEDRIVNIYESQRQEIGQIIHDDLGQQLTGLTFLAESLKGALEEKGLVEDVIRAGVIAERSYQALDDVRRIAHSFYPVQISPAGFEDALLSLASDAQALSGIICRVDNAAGDLSFDNAQATQLYYIVREAVNNAIKHSSAANIRITLSRDSRHVVISVADDGTGFQPVQGGKGIGLDIMEYRTNLSKGRLEISGSSGTGTVVKISIAESECRDV